MARRGLGPAGKCVCLNCNYTTPHAAGVPCNTMVCPKCGGRMRRQ